MVVPTLTNLMTKLTRSSGESPQRTPLHKQQDALRQVFRSIKADSCPHTYNFHMHTVFSDGRLKPEEIINQAIALGLKGLAITDHHSIGGYRIAAQWLAHCQQARGSAQALPTLWTGIEINANLLDIEVHILGYGFDPDRPAMQPYIQGMPVGGSLYQAANVISAIHSAGGLAVLAHPVRYVRSPEDLIAAAAELGIDGVETYYAYGNPNPWTPSPKQTERVKELSTALGLFDSCGTDTHGLSILQRL